MKASFTSVKLLLLLLLCGLLAVGCSKRSWRRIPNDQLQQLLTELYTARGVGQALYISAAEQDSVYASILQAHGVSQEDLDSTIYYLSATKAKVLQKIIAQASASIERDVEILERTTGSFRVGIDGDEGYFYSPLPDTLSRLVTPLSPYPICINKRQSSYHWKIALADIPHLPDTVRQVEIQGLISGTQLPEQGRMPYIALSKQLDATPPPLAVESTSTQLPLGGRFVLTLGTAPTEPTEPTAPQPQEPNSHVDSVANGLADTLSVTPPRKAPHRPVPKFSAGDTLSITIYGLPTAYESERSLLFRLYDLRIIAR